MDVNLPIALKLIPGGKVVSDPTNSEKFLTTNVVIEAVGEVPEKREIIAFADGNKVTVANEEAYIYHPNAQVTGTLG